jgi:hypothetical protein
MSKAAVGGMAPSYGGEVSAEWVGGMAPDIGSSACGP